MQFTANLSTRSEQIITGREKIAYWQLNYHLLVNISLAEADFFLSTFLINSYAFSKRREEKSVISNSGGEHVPSVPPV